MARVPCRAVKHRINFCVHGGSWQVMIESHGTWLMPVHPMNEGRNVTWITKCHLLWLLGYEYQVEGRADNADAQQLCVGHNVQATGR